VTRRLAGACSRHPWRTLAAWIVVLVASCAALATMLDLSDEADVTGNFESRRAADLVFSHGLFDRRPVSVIVVVRSERATAGEPAFRAFLRQLRADAVASQVPVTPAGADQVSRDRHAVALPLTQRGPIEPLVDLVHEHDGRDGFSVTATGDDIVNDDFDTLSQHDLEQGELFFGLPVALVILLLVFGSGVAALLPLTAALLAIVVALGLTGVASQLTGLSIFVVNMISGMGLALGIDYALFVVSRYREERARGREKLAAVEVAGATATRAVLVSGLALVVAMTGMLMVPHTVMRSLAAGAIFVGIASVAAALTLLPALLGLLGDRIEALRLPWLGRVLADSAGREGRFWSAVVGGVLRAPALTLAAALVVLLLAASPVLGLKTGSAGVSTLPDRLLSKQGYLALQRDFGGAGTSPVWVVVQGPGDSRTEQAVVALRHRVGGDPEFGRATVDDSGDPRLRLVSFPVAGDATDARATRAVQELRERVLPGIFHGTGAEVLVGGDTAEELDYEHVMAHWMPIVILFVLGLTFVLLTVVFRSIVVAGTAIVLNLLSVGAAYGVLVLVFQHGVLADFAGLQQVDRIEPWVPLFLFSVLFGLSMDYEVFLLSRIRERFGQTGDSDGSVAYGVGSTARLITGAAAIIIAVFVGFATGDLVPFQQMGVGVAVSLAVDATVIRSVVLPATMRLLGRWNWYLPRWLEWLPRLTLE
jgi:RND superfamily putative drug exporter